MQNDTEKQSEFDQLLAGDTQFSKEHVQRNMKLPLQMCEQGRVLLKEKKYLQASKFFAKSVMAFQFLLKNGLLSQQQTKQMFTQIMIPTYSNLSLCHLKIGSYDSAISFCNQILSHDDSHTKSKYRRGLAYKNLKQYEEAIADFISAGKLDPSIKEQCDRFIRQCKMDIIKQKQRDKKIASAFIGDIKDQRSKKSSLLQQKAESKSKQQSWFKRVMKWITQRCPKTKKI